MNNLDISQYIGKSNGDRIDATVWNGVFGALQTKINEIVAAINESGGGDDPVIEESTLTVTTIGSGTTTYKSSSTSTKVVTLDSTKKYEITGTLYGQIVVDAETVKPEDNTYIRLKGVTVITSSNTGILYKTPTSNTGYKDLVITLDKDSQNFVVCTQSGSIGDDDPAAIYSMNNLVIQGVGYLACYNSAGHGIRGTELRITGPHIYVEAVHDAVHGKKVTVDDGIIYATKANDVIGTADNGTIFFFGGTIYARNNIQGKVINAKGTSGTLVTLSYTTLDNDLDFVDKDSNITLGSAANVYSINKYIQTILPTIVTLECTTKDGQYSDMDFAHSGLEPKLVTMPYVKLSGLITAPILIADTQTALASTGVTIYLENAVLLGGIYYQLTKKSVKIIAVKDTVNKIYCNGATDTSSNIEYYDCVKSESNIKVEVKNNAHLLISARNGDGLDGEEVVITDSKGILMIYDCGERGIKGINTVIGPNCNIAKDVITYITDETSEDYSTLDGAVVVKNNSVGSVSAGTIDNTDPSNPVISSDTGFADIYCRQGKKATKGQFGTKDSCINGVIICGSIGATITMDFDNSDSIYYTESLLGENTSGTASITNDCGPTLATYKAVPYNSNPIS